MNSTEVAGQGEEENAGRSYMLVEGTDHHVHFIYHTSETYWEVRGCPWGSPNEDWCRAEQEIKKSRQWAFPSQR